MVKGLIIINECINVSGSFWHIGGIGLIMKDGLED